jgi:hypothetical protein
VRNNVRNRVFSAITSAFIAFVEGFVELLQEALDFGWVRLHSWVDRKPVGAGLEIGKLFRTKSLDAN